MKITKISRGSVFYSLSAIAASNTLLQLLGFFYRIFLSRMTDAEGLGVYQLVMPFYSVISSLCLSGLTVAVARISAARAATGDFCGARRTVSLSRRVFFISVFAVAAIVLPRARNVAEAALGEARCAPALPFVFVCLFLTGIENIYKNYFYGVGRVAPQIASELSEQIIRALAVAALLIFFRADDPGTCAMLIFIGMVISELFSSSLLSLFYLPEKKRLSSKPKKPPRLRELLAVSIPVSAAATVNNLLSSLNSVLIPLRLRAAGATVRASTEALGVMFGMTMPLLSLPIAFIASLTSIMVPRVSEALAAGNISDIRRKAGKTVHATGLLAMPCIAVMIPLGEDICRLIFSHESAGAFMLPLCIGTLFSYYELTTGALLNGIGMQTRAAVYIVISGIIQLIFTWCIGICGFGMRAFVLGYAVSNGIGAVLNTVCLVRRLGLRLRFGNWIFTPLICSVLSALVCNIVYGELCFRAISPTAALAISAAAGIGTYALSLSALGTSITRYIKTLIPSR
ncbi:MAG: oligosaccharide flippase family protein [Oscillospiraceae bacterium]|nr:oligosaccharide flippase family protein [Oscillospiraceae bacterium]